jgi:hypothetical protein
MAETLLLSSGYRAGQDNTVVFLQEAVKEIGEREKSRYGWQISAMAGLGAAKAFITAGLINFGISKAREFVSSAGAGPTVVPETVSQPQGEVPALEGAGEMAKMTDQSFGHVFQEQTKLSADYLWSWEHGELVGRTLLIDNAGNVDVWKYLDGLAHSGIPERLMPETLGRLDQILDKIGINGAAGDFTPDTDVLQNLNHEDSLYLFKFISGYPGWAQKILGHPLGFVFNKPHLQEAIRQSDFLH